MQYYEKVLTGTMPAKNPFPALCYDPAIRLAGLHIREGFPPAAQEFCLDTPAMARGIAVLGTARSGKTNIIAECVYQQLTSLCGNEKMVIFDVKGEYFAQFGEPDSPYYVDVPAIRIGLETGTRYWNLFRDILAWGDSRNTVKIHANQLTAYLFDGMRSETAPYFVNAARSLVSAVIQHMIRQAKEAGDFSPLDNYALCEFLLSGTGTQYMDILRKYGDLEALCSHITDQKGDPAKDGPGVLSEIALMAAEVFLKNFAESGDFSIVEWMQEAGYGVLYLQFSPHLPDVCGKVFAYLLNSLMDALAAPGMPPPDKTMLVLDEFAQLPRLTSLKRQLTLLPCRNVCVTVGLQDVMQLRRYYSETEAAEMLNLFQNVICLKPTPDTARYMQSRFGKITVQQVYSLPGGTAGTQVVEKEAVSDSNLRNMAQGEAFVLCHTGESFRFRFGLYGA